MYGWHVGKFSDEIPFLLLIDGKRVNILKKEMQELPKMPRELIERFTKETHLNFRCKSDRREAYFLCFLVAFVSRLDSKPTVSCKMYR